MSKGEEKISLILKKNNIKYEREKTFSDLRKGLFRFDFYLPEQKILIEYDGEAHFNNIKAFYKNNTDFIAAKERDREKNSYALARGIKLYRIPYWDFININTFEDLLKDKYLVKSIWHNDRILHKINGD